MASSLQTPEFPFSTTPVSTNLLSGVTWRYDTSANLIRLLTLKQAWYNLNHDTFWNNWITQVFDLTNASNFGCAVWAFILNVPISILGLQQNNRLWAFDATRANFADSTQDPINPSSGNFPPTDQAGAITSLVEARQALRLKYYAHTSQRNVLSLNAMLADVFGPGNAWVLDNQNMTMTYVFNIAISSQFQNAMLQFDLLPRPAGVKIILQVPP